MSQQPNPKPLTHLVIAVHANALNTGYTISAQVSHQIAAAYLAKQSDREAFFLQLRRTLLKAAENPQDFAPDTRKGRKKATKKTESL